MYATVTHLKDLRARWFWVSGAVRGARTRLGSKVVAAAAAEAVGGEQEATDVLRRLLSHEPPRSSDAISVIYSFDPRESLACGPAPGFAGSRSQCVSFPLSLKSLTFPLDSSAAPLCGAAGSWGCTAFGKALGCDLQPRLTLRPWAAESSPSMGSQRRQS